MRKHSNICPDCGAWLDPGERCDCQDAPRDPVSALIHRVSGLPEEDLLQLAAYAKQLENGQQNAVGQAANA